MMKGETDNEVLETYIELENPCLLCAEKKEVMDILYKYKDVFSLRAEIGTRLNIEVKIDATDNSSLDHIIWKKR